MMIQSDSSVISVLSVAIQSEQDIVTARQRARQMAEVTGFDRQDQIRIATAVSEIARNAWQYGKGGRIEFAIVPEPGHASLLIRIGDRGPGIANLQEILQGQYTSKTGMGLGLMGARRLMDDFQIESGSGGTVVRLRKYLPPARATIQKSDLARIAEQLASAGPPSVADELRNQSQDFVNALEELAHREEELRRINQELEDTNRGVVALYAELDDKAASLRRADELKSKFLSHVSHEFRTPLNSILALSGLLLARADGPLTAVQEKQINFIRKAAGDLTEMVNDLLDLAKVEAGMTVLRPADFSVSNLFGALRGMMRPMLSGSVELVVEDPVPDFSLHTDEAKVSQILRNLLSNALKFTDHGEVLVKVAHEDGCVQFSVSDTGVGIAPENLEQIFREFAQVENRLQGRAKGTGLGLSLSRKLAELLGGDLTVSSELGKGSKFTFRLPADCLRTTHSAAPQRAAEPAEHSGSILVIDDDEIARYLVQQALSGTDLSVSEAENGSMGLEKARFERPELIVLDLTMPDLSGFEVLEILRQQNETKDTPVIVFTSRVLTDAEKARLHSASAIMSKLSVSNNSLLSCVQEVLGKGLQPTRQPEVG